MKETRTKTSDYIIRDPISIELKRINPELEMSEYEALLFELDGLNEMLLNYVDTAKDAHERMNFVGTFIMFIAKYDFLTRPENLYVLKIILLNELYKKNQDKMSVIKLVKEEHHFSHQNAAAFKAIVKKELRDICMNEYNITDKSDIRYIDNVKPFVREFEDFYYQFR